MYPHLQWNRVFLLVMSPYIGDPNMIPDHWLRYVLSVPNLTMTLATGCLSHAFPGFIPLLAGPPPHRNTLTTDQLNPPVKLQGGGRPVEALQFHSHPQFQPWVNCLLPV